MNLHGKREVNQTDATKSFRDKTKKRVLYKSLSIKTSNFNNIWQQLMGL